MAEEKEVSTGVRELWGIALLTCGVLLALALFSYQSDDLSLLKAPVNDPPMNYIGPAGAWSSFIMLMGLGVGAFLLPLGLSVLGILLLFRPREIFWQRVVWSGVIILALCCLLTLHPSWWARLCARFNIAQVTGGVLGWLIADHSLARWLGITGATVAVIGFLFGGLVLFIGKQGLLACFQMVSQAVLRLKQTIQARMDSRRTEVEKIVQEERDVAKQRAVLEKAMRREQRLASVLADRDKKPPRPEPISPPVSAPEPISPPLPPPEPPKPPSELKAGTSPTPETAAAKAKSKAAKASKSSAAETVLGSRAPTDSTVAGYKLPPLSLLQPLPAANDRSIKGDYETTARIIKETLEDFGIECEVTHHEQGPVVTRYELLPAPGVKIERITGLSNNLALTLKAHSVRVQAPIPGKGVVGIEVPNSIANKVYLREILESEAWQSSKAAIPLALGKDVAGNDLIADLATMPHLLIAGATGSGKTVCMNSILMGILMTRTPDQLRLMLIDPKRVEFAAYNHLSHLVVPVITDAKKVPLGLRWAIKEMEQRYQLFAKTGVRNIQSYNSRPTTQNLPMMVEGGAAEPAAPPPARIPYIVIIIDELADLMLVAQADIENAIARLAQMSRAVGIHMILATQRPSVNVITGTIKANFPARISFQVAQKVDSRTILDTSGADKLLGRGDMLILPPGTSKLVRAQGAITSDDDVNTVVAFIKQQAEPSYEMAIKESLESESAATSFSADDEGVDNELLDAAKAIIRETRRASVSLLQRRLRIGYNRAGRLMDVLEEQGIVGPVRGSDPREILIDLDGEIPVNTPGNPPAGDNVA